MKSFVWLCLCSFPIWMLGQGDNYTFQNGYLSQQSFQPLSQSNPIDPNSGQPQKLSFTFRLMKNVQPDAMLAIFHVVQLGETVEEVNRLMDERLKGMQAAVKQLGVEETDWFVDLISQVPIYEYETERKLFSKNYVEVPAGFQLQKNIHLRFTDPKLLDDLVRAAAKQEIHDLAKLEYYVDDAQAQYAELKAEALELFGAQKAYYANLDIALDSLFHTIQEQGQAFLPGSRYTSYQAMQQYGYAKGGKSVEKARKPKAQFYQALNLSVFDKVINPRILGPSVQFTYQLQVSYVLPNPVSQNWFLLNAEGDLKSLTVPKE
ncbi:MAG: SIMPL domain-containing protein [Bacteroidota bacterium]